MPPVEPEGGALGVEPPPLRSPVVTRAWQRLEASALEDLRRLRDAHPAPVLVARLLARLDRVWRRPCGFVYRIGPAKGEPDACKLGFSVDPDARLRQLQTGCPFELVIEATYPGRPEVEQAIHDALAECRVRGEWFARGPLVDAASRAMELLAAEVGTQPVRGPVTVSAGPVGVNLDLFERLRSA